MAFRDTRKSLCQPPRPWGGVGVGRQRVAGDPSGRGAFDPRLADGIAVGAPAKYHRKLRFNSLPGGNDSLPGGNPGPRKGGMELP